MSAPFSLPDAERKPTYVREMFNEIAHGYDTANDWITGGMHRAWKRRMVAELGLAPGDQSLDLATGTGDIAHLLKAAVGPEGRVVGLDFSAGMLQQARVREGAEAIEWLEGDMVALPFADASFDTVTVGFGLRNVADLAQALREIARVLKPGGRFASLDMARPRNPIIRLGERTFSAVMVPLIGRMVTGRGDPYRYLHASSVAFMSQDELATRCREAGLEAVRVRDVLLGTCAVVTGRKPAH